LTKFLSKYVFDLTAYNIKIPLLINVINYKISLL
jgi:hypothetical protein